MIPPKKDRLDPDRETLEFEPEEKIEQEHLSEADNVGRDYDEPPNGADDKPEPAKPPETIEPDEDYAISDTPAKE